MCSIAPRPFAPLKGRGSDKEAQALRIGRKTIGIGGVALAAVLALPVLGQESLLPPGFDQPPANRPAQPSPTPSPTPSAPRPASPDTPAPRPSAPAPAAPGAAPGVAAGGLLDGLTSETDALADALPPPPSRYDLPPGSRRLLTRIGPLTPQTGGLPADAFGYRGNYYIALMDKVEAPLLSRWGSVLLRRALLSGVDTPATVNGADFVASRAALLLRSGESAAARMLVQSVDVDRASPRLRKVAFDVFVANADPAGLCPYVGPVVGAGGHDAKWDVAQAMCAALGGEAGTASAVIERVRRRGRLERIDVILGEKVVGAGVDGRRSVLVQWDDVEAMTPWRFGLATTTGVEIPADLWGKATPAMRSWALQSPMIGLDRRFGLAADAARSGVLSARGYVDLVSYAASFDEPADDVADLAETLRTAFVAAELSARIDAIRTLGAGEAGAASNYPGQVLAARAAARIAPVDVSDEDARMLLAAMFAGGLDRNAMAWAPQVAVGSPAWGLLAVGSPRPLVNVTGSRVGDFADDDDSAGGLRSRFLAAALIGLGRLDPDDVATVSRDQRLALGTATRWTRAIDAAAQAGEPGTVALLAAVGMQGDDWSQLPPYHLYHITRALRLVGLGAEARMIAAEALTRV